MPPTRGADVVDLGLVGTEMVYFATDALSLDGGIMVTASHNPKQYTGMKIVRRGALPVGSESGLFEIRDRALRASGARRRAARSATRTSGIGFVERVLGFVDVDAIAPVRIVVDAANGMAGVMLPHVLDRLPQVDVVRCYFEPDGTFPNHEPNPLLPGEPRVHRREDARRGRGVRGRLRRRRRPLLLRRRHAASSSPATS